MDYKEFRSNIQIATYAILKEDFKEIVKLQELFDKKLNIVLTVLSPFIHDLNRLGEQTQP